VLLSTCEQRVRKDSKQRGRSGIYLDTSGLSKGAGNEGIREAILSAAKDLKFFRRPEGKKWSSFFLKKSKFVASEVSMKTRVISEPR
jgi:hypothetical protein